MEEKKEKEEKNIWSFFKNTDIYRNNISSLYVE